MRKVNTDTHAEALANALDPTGANFFVIGITLYFFSYVLIVRIGENYQLGFTITLCAWALNFLLAAAALLYIRSKLASGIMMVRAANDTLLGGTDEFTCV